MRYQERPCGRRRREAVGPVVILKHPLACRMSPLGHEQTSRHVRVMSVIPLKADIHQRGLHVRLVPKADLGDGERYITGIPSDFYLYR